MKILIFQDTESEKKTLAHSMKILKLLVVIFVITIRREDYQKRCELP